MHDEDDSDTGMPRMWRNWLMPAGVVLCGVSGISGAFALLLGIGTAFLTVHTESEYWHRRAHWLLQGSVVALGGAMNLPEVARAGMDGMEVTFISICAIFLFGNWMGRHLKLPRHSRTLISAGTAICGGSAIAALAAVMRPPRQETAAALGIVFILNAVALLIFPLVGHWLNLSETAFGWWAALAIHDTSSVVGAGMAYGLQALTVATTIKLARALWIVPVALLFAYLEGRHDSPDATSTGRITFPWFILGFLALAAIRWTFPALEPLGDGIARLGHHGLSAALFLIGAGINPTALKQMGWSPALLGVGIWIPTTVCALLFVVLCR